MTIGQNPNLTKSRIRIIVYIEKGFYQKVRERERTRQIEKEFVNKSSFLVVELKRSLIRPF